MKERFRSIRGRLILTTSVAVLVSVLAIGILGIQYIRRSTTEYLDELLMLKCDNIEEGLNSYLDSIEQCVDTIAHYAGDDYEEMGQVSEDALADHLKTAELLFHSEVVNTDGIITYYYRVSPDVSTVNEGFWYQKQSDGSYKKGELTDVGAYEGNEEGRAEWFYTPKREGKSVWLEPYENKNMGGTKMISYVTPIYKDKKFMGVIGIDYDYKTLTEKIEYDGHFVGAYTFLADANDRIIYHPTLAAGTDVNEESEVLSGIMQSKEQDVNRISYNGEIKRITWSELSNGMKLFLVTPEKSYKRYWYKFTHAFILGGIILVIFAILFSIWLANRLTRPLTDLTDAAKKIDQGDYDVDLSYNGDNEIGVLTKAVRQLSEHLQVHIKDLNDKAYTDALTHVRNKGAFDMYTKKIDDDLKFGGEDAIKNFAICIFDCNNLKEMNDKHGHNNGDIFIKGCCKLVCDVFRHSPVFRIGGDEFACVLQGADYESREELLTLFELRAVQINREAEHPWERIDMACGYADYDPETDKIVKDVFKRADKDMYKDKERMKAGLESERLQDLEV